MAHLGLGSPKTGPMPSPSDPPAAAGVGAPAKRGGGAAHGNGQNRGHSHSHGPGGGHNHSHSHGGHHGHSHSHGGRNVGDPAAVGRGVFVPMAFLVLSAAVTYYASWPSAHQWHEPIDHGAPFSGWLYASHGAWSGSVSASSQAPSGFPLWNYLNADASSSKDLAALPSASASAQADPKAAARVEREKDVVALSTRLARQSQVLVYGAAGAGQVDVAAAYAAQTRANYSVSLWFTNAATSNALWRQYAQLSQRIGLRSTSLRPGVLVPNVLSWLYRFVPATLTVLDRADADASVFVSGKECDAAAKAAAEEGAGASLDALTATELEGAWLPRRGHSIIVSTRALKGFKSKLELAPATSRAAAIAYLAGTAASAGDDAALTSAYPQHAAVAELCADRVSCLTLARAALRTVGSAGELTSVLRKRIAGIDAAVLSATTTAAAAASAEQSQRLVAVTSSALLLHAVSRVQAKAGAAWTVLKALSVMDANDAVPRALLDGAAKAGPVTAALAELEVLALVQYTATDVWISATAQAAVRSALTGAEVAASAVAALEALNRTMAYSSTREDTWLPASAALAHVLALTRHAAPGSVTLVSALKALANVCAQSAAFAHDVLGETDVALVLLQRGAAYVAPIDDGNSDAHARVQSGLAVVYSATGQHDKAVASATLARDIAVELYGETSERAAAELTAMAAALKGKAEYGKAKDALDSAVAIHKQLYGDRNEVADDYALMAAVAQAKGDANEALRMLTRALELNTRAPHSLEQELLIASRYSAIGDAWLALNRHVDAINFWTRAVEVYRNTYDSLHPALADAHVRLGGLFQQLGRWAQARSNYKKALDIYQQAAGDVHPQLLQLIGDLGTVINAMGNSDVALSYYNHCWNICLSLYGEAHPKTAEWKQKTMDLYAAVQKKNAEYEARRKREAEEKERAAAAAARKQQGANAEL